MTWERIEKIAAAWLPPHLESFIHGLASALPLNTQGGSPVRESRTLGSVRGRSVMSIPTVIRGKFEPVVNAIPKGK
jgi:hypothetical protein